MQLILFKIENMISLFLWKEISFLKTGDGRNRKLNFTLGVRESTHYTAVYMIKAVEAENCQSEEKSCKQKLAYYLLLPILTASIPPWIEWIQKIRSFCPNDNTFILINHIWSYPALHPYGGVLSLSSEDHLKVNLKIAKNKVLFWLFYEFN